jgi:hypothetical protein
MSFITMVIVIINNSIKICYYNMFTLEQQIFIAQCFFSNRERLGPISHLEFLRNFNKSFRTFNALNQQLAQKVYKCVNMFLETGIVQFLPFCDDVII